MSKFTVKIKNCSYGTKGDVVELKGVSELSERQKTMLAPYEPPNVKTLEVATPGGKGATAQQLVAEIKGMEDREALEAHLDDARKTVSEAALARLEELDAETEE